MEKHVYCQKPLTHTVFEARRMRETAKKMGVATQMGNQGTAADGLRRAVEIIQAGGIGTVTRGPRLDQPAHLAAGADRHQAAEPREDSGQRPLGRVARPGPGTPLRQGLPPVHLARLVGLRHRRPGRHGLPHRQHGVHGPEARPYPTSIQAENDPVNPETYPAWARITFQFPSRGDKGPVKFIWYEGKKGRQKRAARRGPGQGPGQA